MSPVWTRKTASRKFYGIFLSLAALSGLLYGAGFLVPIQGPWVDFAASSYLSHQINFSARCEKTKVTGWAEASFAAMTLGTNPNEPLLSTGPGNVYFSKKPFVVIDVDRLRLAEAIPASKLLSSWPLAKGLEGPWELRRLRAGFLADRPTRLIRIFQCDSRDFSLRGGLVFQDKRLTRAHLYFSLAPERLKKLPPQIRVRMSQEKGGWAAVHIIYNKNQLTLRGRRGPLFQATWQGSGLGAQD